MRWFARAHTSSSAPSQINGQIVNIETRTGPVPVELRQHARARRYSLRQSAYSKYISLVIPEGGDVQAALAFARSQAGWLARQMQQTAPSKPFVDGGIFPFKGQDYELQHSPGFRGAVRIRNRAGNAIPVIDVTAPPEHLARRFRDWLKKQAREELCSRVEAHTRKLNIKAGRITVRDQSSRWGSCSSRGNLNFSWRLILAPPEVLDYVTAHEVAHLLEMNHSSRFWKIVETLRPDMKMQRRWLRQNSAELHAVGRDE